MGRNWLTMQNRQYTVWSKRWFFGGGGGRRRLKRVKEVKYLVMERNLTLGGEHTMGYTGILFPRRHLKSEQDPTAPGAMRHAGLEQQQKQPTSRSGDSRQRRSEATPWASCHQRGTRKTSENFTFPRKVCKWLRNRWIDQSDLLCQDCENLFCMHTSRTRDQPSRDSNFRVKLPLATKCILLLSWNEIKGSKFTNCKLCCVTEAHIPPSISFYIYSCLSMFFFQWLE